MQKQGKIFQSREAVLDGEVRTENVSFFQGDACNLSEDLGNKII
jgi:hypothetical protein